MPSRVSGRLRPELAEDLLVGNTLATGERSARSVQCNCRLRRQVFFLNGSGGKVAGKGFNQELEKVAHGVELLPGQCVDEIVGLLALLYEIKFHVLHRQSQREFL